MCCRPVDLLPLPCCAGVAGLQPDKALFAGTMQHSCGRLLMAAARYKQAKSAEQLKCIPQSCLSCCCLICPICTAQKPHKSMHLPFDALPGQCTCKALCSAFPLSRPCLLEGHAAPLLTC